MASRLSEDHLRGVYDTGHQALPIRAPISELAPPSVDLDALLLAEDPMGAVQAVPSQTLYHALLEKGPEDCLEVLELVSQEQLTSILDYDAWADDRLSPLKVIRWFDLFKELGTEQFFQRFRDLEEEYQIALLGPLIDVLDEEQYEKLTDGRQDEFHRLPCGTLFYKVKSADPRVLGFVDSLVESTLAHDLNYAYALLTHAAFMPPQESEADLARFRQARLEEDGFVTYQEGLTYFRDLDLAKVRRQWPQKSGAAGLDEVMPTLLPEGVRLLEQALASDAFSPQERETLSRGFAVLANALCAATKIEPDDVRGLRRLFSHAQALANLGLEWLACGDIAQAVAILKVESPQVLFRVALSLVHHVTHSFADQLKKRGVVDGEKVSQLVASDRLGVVLSVIDQSLLPVLGTERIEILKGAFNRFPVRPVHPVSVSGQKDVAHIEFVPIDSIRSLHALRENLDKISGILYVASLALGEGPIGARSVDGVILRALGHVVLGGSFACHAFDDEALQKLSQLHRKDVLRGLDEVLSGIEGTLKLSLLPQPDQVDGPKHWTMVGLEASRPSYNPVGEVMTELTTLKDQFLVAHHHGHLCELLTEALQ